MSNSRYGTDNADAADILRSYKDRIERLEQDRASNTNVQLVRDVNEVATVADTVSYTELAAGDGFVYGTDEYGRQGWG